MGPFMNRARGVLAPATTGASVLTHAAPSNTRRDREGNVRRPLSRFLFSLLEHLGPPPGAPVLSDSDDDSDAPAAPPPPGSRTTRISDVGFRRTPQSSQPRPQPAAAEFRHRQPLPRRLLAKRPPVGVR